MAKNIYVRGKKYWARFQIAGEKYRRTLHVSVESKGAATKAIRALEKLKGEIEDDIRHGNVPPILWQRAVVAWHEVIGSSISSKTIRRYLVSLNQCSEWLAGRPLSEINGTLLRSIIKERRRLGATNATIKRDLTAISSVLNVAIDEDWIEINHALMLNRRRIPERRDPIMLPTDYSIAAMRSACSVILADMIDFANETGMRQDEIVQLERRSIEETREEATLHKTKRKKMRTIDFSEAAMKIVARQPLCPSTDLVFWEGEGRPIDWVSSRFCAVARKVAQSDRKFVRFRFHDLRRNFAVRYLRERRGSLQDLQKTLGHKSVKTTEQYLEHLTPSEQTYAQSVVAQKVAQHQRFNNESEEDDG
jgi:integrase/recombinase XerD